MASSLNWNIWASCLTGDATPTGTHRCCRGLIHFCKTQPSPGWRETLVFCVCVCRFSAAQATICYLLSRRCGHPRDISGGGRPNSSANRIVSEFPVAACGLGGAAAEARGRAGLPACENRQDLPEHGVLRADRGPHMALPASRSRPDGRRQSPRVRRRLERRRDTPLPLHGHLRLQLLEPVLDDIDLRGPLRRGLRVHCEEPLGVGVKVEQPAGWLSGTSFATG